MAREALAKTVALDPDDALALSRLGAFMSRYENDAASAAPYFERALALEPGNVSVIGNVAAYLFSLGKLDESIALRSYQVARDPANSSVHNSLGVQNYIAGRLDEAIDALIVAHANDSAWIIAMVYAWRGETDRAFEWLDKAMANQEAIVETVHFPLFATLHDDALWLPLLRRLGQAPEQLAAIKFDVKLPQ
jgi:tetratricopeptide (TPR) repeat protein